VVNSNLATISITMSDVKMSLVTKLLYILNVVMVVQLIPLTKMSMNPV